MTKRILAVDDDEGILKLLRHILQRLGHDVVTAENGTEALEAVRAGPFDLILLDIMMPDVDGYTVCRDIKADPERRDIPVVFVSAKVDTDSMAHGFECGASHYLTKPLRPPELIQVVQGILAASDDPQ